MSTSIDHFADALLNLSLVDSLFLSVSIDASRARILMYLTLTAAPLVVVAPLIGNVLDRTRVGYGRVLAASQVLRAAASLALIGSLLTVALYPLAFTVLLSRKVYAVAKNTLLSRMAPDRDALVRSDAHISRSSTISGGVGTAVAGLLLVATETQLILMCAAVAYLTAALVSRRLQPGDPSVALFPVEPFAHVIPRRLWTAAVAVTALRATAGALTYLLAFAMKRGGGDTWIFAAALVAAGVGRMMANLAAGPIHRSIHADWALVLALLVPGMVCAIGVITVGNLGVMAIALFIGVGNAVGARTITMLNASVPVLARGRAIARTELLFQVASLLGAILALQFAVTPTAGFAASSVVLLVAGSLLALQRRQSLRLHASRMLLGGDAPAIDRTLPEALLVEAHRLASLGAYRMAVVVATAAVDVLLDREPALVATGQHRAWLSRCEEASLVRTSDVQPDEELVLAVLTNAQRLIEGATVGRGG